MTRDISSVQTAQTTTTQAEASDRDISSVQTAQTTTTQTEVSDRDISSVQTAQTTTTQTEVNDKRHIQCADSPDNYYTGRGKMIETYPVCRQPRQLLHRQR